MYAHHGVSATCLCNHGHIGTSKSIRYNANKKKLKKKKRYIYLIFKFRIQGFWLLHKIRTTKTKIRIGMLYIHLKGGLQRIPLSDRYFGVWVPEKRVDWLNVKIGNSYLNPAVNMVINGWWIFAHVLATLPIKMTLLHHVALSSRKRKRKLK